MTFYDNGYYTNWQFWQTGTGMITSGAIQINGELITTGVWPAQWEPAHQPDDELTQKMTEVQTRLQRATNRVAELRRQLVRTPGPEKMAVLQQALEVWEEAQREMDALLVQAYRLAQMELPEEGEPAEPVTQVTE